MKLLYDPEICETLPSLFENGESIVEVAKKLGIGRQTYYDWLEKYPEFKAANEEGLSLAEAWWSTLGRAGAMGKVGINAPVWIFNMKNRYKWTDRQEQTHQDPDGKPMSPSIIFAPVGRDNEPAD